MTAGTALIILIIFLQPEWFSSRFVILTGWALAILLISTTRYLINFLQKFLLIYKGFGVYKLAVIGKGAFCDRVCRQFSENPEDGYKVVAQEDRINLEASTVFSK